MSRSTVYRNALQTRTMLMEYRLDAVLGAGGFGLTYLAWDGHLEKHVAVKEYLPAELAMRSQDGTIVPVTSNREYDYQWGLERFLQEARTLARFTHPHIVRVNRYFEANGTAYMVMDYEKGEPMSQLLKREPFPDETKLRAILMPLLDGLRAVHEAGFLHRDIKPGNIFLREQGSPVLIDFGSARHALGGARDNYTAVVTPGYAPLEQYTADGRQGAWSDIYALSGVFCRAVTQHSPPDAVSRLRRDIVPQMLATARGRYSEQLLEALNWGLAMDDHRRPQSVAEWLPVLSGAAKAPLVLPLGSALDGGEEVRDLPTMISHRTGESRVEDDRVVEQARPYRKLRWLAFGIAGACVLVAGAAWQLGTQYVQEAPTARTVSIVPDVVNEAVPVPDVPAAQRPPRAHATPQHRHQRAEAPRRSLTMTPAAKKNAVVLSPEEVETVGEEPTDRLVENTLPQPQPPVQAKAKAPAPAPVRDAVLLPPLASAPYERPTRDRSPRPGDIR
ncbi:MAG TPA: serine/threonine-protein kinase [Burkholderiales bacterium]|nr:serine/threonine-protein kinase [Burkholderiales bacterium]